MTVPPLPPLNVPTFADELKENLAPWMTPSLSIFCDAIGVMFQPIRELIYDRGGFPGDPGYLSGWSILYDVDYCPFQYLGYLAQIVGVAIPPGTNEADARQMVRDENNQRRGTVGAIRSAVQRSLTGTRACTIYEREDGSGTDHAYAMLVITYTGETPDTALVATRAGEQKPAGIIATYRVDNGWSYGQAEAAYATYTLAQAAYATYAPAESVIPS